MAVFLLNICKFNGCGITFPSLSDLITHIEDTHIDYDPKVVEQKELSQPACLPLSYVLRFISDNARKDGPFLTTSATGVDLKRKLAIKHHSYSMSSSNRSNTPTGSEIDDDEMVNTESEDSNESWTTEEFSSEFIMRYGSRHSGIGITGGTSGHEKPFACPVPGCKKRYKNVNGIKYHSKNGHKKDGKVRKGYKCHCGKSYKTAQGLKNHALVTHNNNSSNSDSNILNSNSGANTGVVIIQRSISPSQSLGSLSPSSISNMSSSASSCHGSNGTHSNTSAVLQQLTGNSSGSQTVQISNGGLSIQQQLINITAIQNHNNNNSSSNNSNSQQQQSSIQQQQQQQSPHLVSTAQTTDTTSLQKLSSSLSSMMTSPSSSLNSSLNACLTTTVTTTDAAVNSSSSNLPTTNTSIVKKMPITMPQPLLGTTLRSTMPSLANATSYSTAAVPQIPTQPPMISPTFIEHKYSANFYKEKFMSNIRNSSQMNTAAATPTATTAPTTNHTNLTFRTNSSQMKSSETENTERRNFNNNNIDNKTNAMLRSESSSMTNSSRNPPPNTGEMCSIQQLNETFKNNFFKKTIN